MTKYNGVCINCYRYDFNISIVRPECRGLSMAAACVACWISVGLCCHTVDILPLDGYYCNTQGDLDSMTTESLRLCWMNCLFNTRCKAVSFNTQLKTCTRHTMPYLFPHVQADMVYHRLKMPSNGKFHYHQWVLC